MRRNRSTRLVPLGDIRLVSESHTAPVASTAVESQLAIHSRLVHHRTRLESALKELPEDKIVERREVESKILELRLVDHQRRVREQLTYHGRELVREEQQIAPYQIIDQSGNVTKLFDNKQFNVRPAFFEDEKKIDTANQSPIKAEADSTLAAAPLSPQPASSSSLYTPSVNADGVNGVMPSPSPPSSSAPSYSLHNHKLPSMPHMNLFTTPFAVPSLSSQSNLPSRLNSSPPSSSTGSGTKRLASVNNPRGLSVTSPSTPTPTTTAAAATFLSSTNTTSGSHNGPQPNVPHHLRPLWQQLTSEPGYQQRILNEMITSDVKVDPATGILPPVPFAHLQQLTVLQQHHNNAMNSSAAVARSVPSPTSALYGKQISAVQRGQQLAFLLKMYEDHQKRHAILPHPFPHPSSTAFEIHAKYEQQRRERLALDQQRLAENEAQRRRREEHKAFLQAVKSHRDVFLQYHKDHRKLLKSLAGACAKIESDLQRKRQLEEARQARAQIREAEQRLAALKSNNLPEYLKLIKDCKSQRIQLLLDQTTKWEAKLRLMMKEARSKGRKQEQIELMKRQLKEEAIATTTVAAAKIEKEEDKEDQNGPSAAAAAAAAATARSDKSELKQEAATPIEDEDFFDLSNAPTVTQPQLMTGGELKQYQLVGIQWMASLYNNHLNGILADEMGLGKTIQCIGLIAHLMEVKRNPGPYLVIAPLSTLKNWRSEFNRWTPSIQVVWYVGTPDQRSALWKNNLKEGTYNVLLTSYEYIMNKHDRAKLCAVPWKYIIIDEGHRVKNHQSKLSVTLAERYRHCPHRLILSGTPLQNSLIELWSLLNFLLPTIFDSAESFEEWFSKPFQQQGISNDGEPTDSMLDEEEKLLIIHRLHTILRPFLLRRMKIDVASQLPPKTEIIVKCQLTPWQRIVYDQIKSKSGLQTVDAAGNVKPKMMSNMFMQLRKITNHPYLFELTNPDFQTNYVVGPDLIRSSGKFDLLHRMIPKLIQSGHKILLFSQMTKVLDLIEDYCRWKLIKFVRLDGSSMSDVRSKAQDDFNAPGSDIHLFLMSTRAGGLGLNLQVADTVILFDSDWNPQADLQAMDRAHRLGQKREVRCFRLISLSPVEEKILARAQSKLKIDQMVIQSGKFDANKKSSSEERQELLQDILRQDITLGAADAPTDSEVNRLMARSEAEFELFQQMDREITQADEAEWIDRFKRPRPDRFITEEELPLHIRQADIGKIIEEEELKQDKASRASRKSIGGYSETLSDRQWTKCIELGLDEHKEH